MKSRPGKENRRSAAKHRLGNHPKKMKQWSNEAMLG